MQFLNFAGTDAELTYESIENHRSLLRGQQRGKLLEAINDLKNVVPIYRPKNPETTEKSTRMPMGFVYYVSGEKLSRLRRFCNLISGRRSIGRHLVLVLSTLVYQYDANDIEDAPNEKEGLYEARNMVGNMIAYVNGYNPNIGIFIFPSQCLIFEHI